MGGRSCTTNVEGCQHSDHLQKGDRTECGNYLISVVGKIFVRILLSRLTSHITPELIPETQCDFRLNRTTVDMILCLRQLPEKSTTMIESLYTGMMVNVRNGGGGLGYICYNKRCQLGVRNGSQVFLGILISNAQRIHTSLQLHTSEQRQNHKYTCETAFRRRQRTDCPLS